MEKLNKNKTKYEGFTLIEMLITMAVMIIVFLAVGNLLNTLIQTSNTVSSRMLVREEGEYLAEVFRRYIRNSSVDNVRLFYRENSRITFDENYQVIELPHEPSNIVEVTESANPATEIHFHPSVDTNRVICMGFFESEDGVGHLVRSSVTGVSIAGGYQPEMCFNPGTQDFRKNFMVLNSNLVHVEGLEIRRDMTRTNVYYSIDIDMKPYWGLGGLSNYRDAEGSPKYRKSFVVQTRLLYHW